MAVTLVWYQAGLVVVVVSVVDMMMAEGIVSVGGVNVRGLMGGIRE